MQPRKEWSMQKICDLVEEKFGKRPCLHQVQLLRSCGLDEMLLVVRVQGLERRSPSGFRRSAPDMYSQGSFTKKLYYTEN